jgi:transcription antitermination factor NusA-like protein
MSNIIDMQDLRYLNLFGKITKVSTRFCFKYNEAIFFCVPKSFISRAIGENGENVKKMSFILKRKIKVIPLPRRIEDLRRFIELIVSPVVFKKVDVSDDEIVLTAGPQSKAALLGRNKRRLIEMQKIVKTFFNRGFRII